jgi:hypothetical protein
MVTDDGLFPEPPRTMPAPAEKLTAGEKMRRRQATRILRGYHPLGEPLRLHPDACRDPDDRTGPGPRCGACRWRQIAGGNRGFPKCFHGEQQIPIPPEQRHPHGATHRILTPRVTHSETSDVRAWWPACRDFEPADGGR